MKQSLQNILYEKVLPVLNRENVSNQLRSTTLKLANETAWRANLRFHKNAGSKLGDYVVQNTKQYVEAIAPLSRVTVMLGVTTKCQCSCPHCGSAEFMKDSRGELKRDGLIRVIDQCAQLGAFQVYLFGGEPLVVKDTPELVRYARKKGLIVSLDTNGLELDDWMAWKLKSADINRVRISIDSVEPGKHDELRGKKGVFDKAVAGFDHCKNHGIEVHMSTYATKENLANGQLARVVDFAESINVKVRVLSPICAGKWEDMSGVVLSSEEISHLKSVIDPEVAYWEEEWSDSKDKPLFCSARDKMIIYVNALGDVHPCCYLNVPFGNVQEEPLRDIVNRMWGNEVFCGGGKCDDCAANDKEFLKDLHQWQSDSKKMKAGG